jgi:hypothetical protein
LQVRCGKPATAATRRGLELCPEHETERAQALARARERKARR